MSRSGYTEYDGPYDDAESQWRYIRFQGALKSAVRGKRGQSFLRDLLAALDAMPDKRLAANVFVRDDGCACALGVLGAARGIDVERFNVDPPAEGEECCDYYPECACGDYEPDHAAIAEAFGVAEILARQVISENDEFCRDDPARWRAVRAWVARQIT